jgi:hypothetical protein
MVEERETINHKTLETRESLEAVSKPFRMWPSIDLSMSWRKLEGVRELAHKQPRVR